MTDTTNQAENNLDDGQIDPATLLMARLKQDPRMAGVPMYVTYPDESTLSMESVDDAGGTP